MIIRWLAPLFLLLLAGCATPVPTIQPVALATPEWPEPVSAVLEQEQSVVPIIDVGVVIFDAGLAERAQDTERQVRTIEVRLLAHRLRHNLETSGAWGAVRILPTPSPLVPVTVTGRIVHSTGSDLVVDIDVADSTGRLWFSERLRGRAPADAYPVASGADPFDGLWAVVANRMRDQWLAMAVRERKRVQQVATLRYAAQLAPHVFADYIDHNEGRTTIRRLPAPGDPMLARVARIRDYEYTFIDVVDEQFVELEQAVGPTYNAWREVTQAQSSWMSAYRDRVEARSTANSEGEFARLHSAYATYRAVRVQQQDLFDFARGFSNESTPTVLAYQNRVIELEGTLSERYLAWRQLLRDIFALEQGNAD